MKNLIIISLVLVLFSCKKDEVKPKDKRTISVEYSADKKFQYTFDYRLDNTKFNRIDSSTIKSGYNFGGGKGGSFMVRVSTGDNSSKTIKINVDGKDIVNQTNTTEPFVVNVTIP